MTKLTVKKLGKVDEDFIAVVKETLEFLQDYHLEA
jgi:hypothetical protein